MSEINIQPNIEIERNWAMLAHLLGLVPIPLVGILGPLGIMLIKKGESAFVETHAREAMSFQITVLIAAIISAWLCFFLIGFLFLAIVFIANFILIISAAVKAKSGENFRYPFSLRFF